MKFNHTAHKALWKWLAKNPVSFKFEWPGWEENGGECPSVYNDCFACLYPSDGVCTTGKECPLEWPLNARGEPACVQEGLFSLWSDAPLGSQERSSLAHQIANLPVKPGVECE